MEPTNICYKKRNIVYIIVGINRATGEYEGAVRTVYKHIKDAQDFLVSIGAEKSQEVLYQTPCENFFILECDFKK